MAANPGPPTDVASVLARIDRPRRAVVTAGMPYANGPLHLGHLAGAHLPADIHARYYGLLIGRENVMFVCGSDEHGSTSELSALKAEKPIREFIDAMHDRQQATLDRFDIGLDVYTGTSRPECFPTHAALSQDFLRKLHANGLLEKRTSKQWYDPKVGRFLPDRFVVGKCPNPKCDNDRAYSDECDRCGHQYEPEELLEPKSTVSDATPEMRDTVHWYLNMWAVSETMRTWIQSKSKTWRNSVLTMVLDKVLPALRIQRAVEEQYKALKGEIPAHKFKYTADKQLVLQFASKPELETARAKLTAAGVASEYADEWGHRSITRDIAWGIPVPDIDPDLAGKTLYVWPDSLIAPISFTKVALAKKGKDPEEYAKFWRDPAAKIFQFLGQDNVFFYVLMQGAMWLGTQSDPHRMPAAGDLTLTEIFGCYHLLVNGEKMSKARGNFFTGDQLLDEKGYSVDQLRYYVALLGLSEKQSDFDFKKLDDRNKFLAGPMNAAFEKPLSAAISKFGGRVPEGVLDPKVVAETLRIVQRYVKAMERADYPSLLFELENYARTINSLFTQHKPHDDRHPEEPRRNALYTCFYVLKNLMIMLYPFVPATMERVRESLKLPSSVWSIDELGKPIPAGHEVGAKGVYFPPVGGDEATTSRESE
ncbi:MAG: class I tRNA ligase family protein [Myxococcales bacterium]|nr:class I tRNA ligase family protein [Myxococcales bacterium]